MQMMRMHTVVSIEVNGITTVWATVQVILGTHVHMTAVFDGIALCLRTVHEVVHCFGVEDTNTRIVVAL